MNRAEKTELFYAKSKASYYIVESLEDLIYKLAQTDTVALDFETTALSPIHKGGRVRLTSLCCDKFHLVVDHNIIGEFDKIIPYLGGKTIWVYNAKFEKKWANYYCDKAKQPHLAIFDIDYLAKCVIGGHHTSFKIMCGRDLAIDVEKEEQLSDWSSATLTESQLDYAAFDSYALWELVVYWNDRATDEQFNAMYIFNDAVEATIEAEETGLYLDVDLHYDTIQLWKRKHATFERYLRRYCTPEHVKNLNSDTQLGKFIAAQLDEKTLLGWPSTPKTGRLQLEGKYLRQVARHFPYPFSRWLGALAGYKYYSKYLSTYGETLITKQELSGRVNSRYNIAQAKTGRYSSSNINKQNIPRKYIVRKAFCADPDEDEILLLADYKGIEIRVLAELSGDKQLLEDAIYGDVHAASAAAIYKHDIDYIAEVLESKGEGRYSNIYPLIKEQRSKAKGFTFQLTYGAGHNALSHTLRCSPEEAASAMVAWGQRYSNAYHYRDGMFEHMRRTGHLPVCDGRTIEIIKPDRTMPVAANYPIQGAAASVMYRAMYHVHHLFMLKKLHCRIAATVHDELLSTSTKAHSEEGMKLQAEGMRLGWLDIFPGTNTDNLIEAVIGTAWSDKP